jgi:hypothetical protein
MLLIPAEEEIAHQSENPPTTPTGDDLFVTLLSPNRPFAPKPHDHKVPPVLMAKLFSRPPHTSHQFVNPPTTLTGDDLSVVVLSPNVPERFRPHDQTTPGGLKPTE